MIAVITPPNAYKVPTCAYIIRSNGTWSYGVHGGVEPLSHYGIDQDGKKRVYSGIVEHNQGLRPVGYGLHVFHFGNKEKNVPDTMIATVSEEVFEGAKQQLGADLSIEDEKIKACFQEVFSRPASKIGLYADKLLELAQADSLRTQPGLFD